MVEQTQALFYKKVNLNNCFDRNPESYIVSLGNNNKSTDNKFECGTQGSCLLIVE